MNPKKRYKLAEDLKNFRTGEMVCKVKKSSQTDVRVDYYFFWFSFSPWFHLLAAKPGQLIKLRQKTDSNIQLFI